MLEWFSNFFTWMQGLSPVWAYLTLFLIAYGENVMPPIPGDMVVVFGGYLAGLGQLHLGVVVGLATLGGAVGFMTMFAIGRRFGQAVLDHRRFRWLPRDGVERARRWIHRYGYAVIAANRFLSGARSVISLTAGMARMEPARTLWWCTVSALVWTGLISYAGYAVGDNWPVVVEYLRAYGRVVLALLLVGLGALGARWYWRRRRTTGSETPDETPPASRDTSPE
jgi:membrane protein DedA with SNARE-associated domain